MTTPAWPSIPAMLDSTADRFAEMVAVRDGAADLSYAALARAAQTFGAALVEAGVEPGDRVAIWCGNCAEWIVAALGLFAAGAVLVPVNTRFKGAEAADILSRSGARVLVTVTDFLGTDYVAMLEGAGVDLPALETIVIARGPSDGSVTWRGRTSWTRQRRRPWPRWGAAAPPSGPTIPLTSSSPPGRPASRRASS